MPVANIVQPMKLDSHMSNFDLERLKVIIRERSYRSDGPFQLASGRQSDFIFDMKPTMMSPEGAFLLSKLLIQELRDLDVDYIGGLELGAVPIVVSTCLALYSETDLDIGAFLIRKKSKEHGTQKLIEGLASDESLVGKKVVIFEDVTTTGGSSLKAVEAVKEAGGEVSCVLTIVDREEGASDRFEKNGLPFIPLLKVSDFT